MWSLVRRDPALENFGRWLLIAPVSSSLLFGVVSLLLLQDPDRTTGWRVPLMAITLWMPVALYLLLGGARRRCSEIDLGLPLSASQLWRAHLVTVIGCSLVILATTWLIVFAHFAALERLTPGLEILDTGRIDLALLVPAGLILAVVLLQRRSPELHAARRDAGYVLFTVIVLAATCLLVLGMSRAHPAFALVLLGAAAVIAIDTARRLPPSLALAPRSVEPAERAAADRGGATLTSGRPAGRLHLLLTIHLALGKSLLVTGFAVPFLALWGAFFAGWLVHEEELRLTLVFLTGYLLFTVTAATSPFLHVVDPFPVSRRTLFALLVVPAFASLSLGYGLGAAALRAGGHLRIDVAFQAEPTRLIPAYRSDPIVRLPAEAYRLSGAGELPVLEAPWGESHPAWRYPVVRGLAPALWSPYHSPGEPSARFVAWQMASAAEELWGVRLEQAAIEAAVEQARAGGDGFTLSQLFPDLPRRSTRGLFPVLFSAVGAIWMLWNAIYFRSIRASRTDLHRKVVFGLLVVAAIGLHIALMAVFVLDRAEPDAVTGALSVGLGRLAERLPGGSPATWLLCLLPFAVTYLLAERQLMRAEFPKTACKPLIG